MVRLPVHTLLLLALTCIAVARPARAQEVGTVAAIEGSAQIGRDGTWTDATAGAAVLRGDQLRTGRPGRLRVVFQDDSVLTLSDGSQMTVNDQTFDPQRGKGRSLFQLVRGKVDALVSDYYHRSGTSYEIETPTAVAGVRGTDFIVKYDDADEVTEVVGLSGEVQVHSLLARSGPGVYVRAGQGTQIRRGQRPTAPQRFDDAIFRQQLEGLNFASVGRFASLTVGNPLATGASVPQSVRAAESGPATTGVPVETLREHRTASDILQQPPAVLQSETGSLHVRLF